MRAGVRPRRRPSQPKAQRARAPRFPPESDLRPLDEHARMRSRELRRRNAGYSTSVGTRAGLDLAQYLFPFLDGRELLLQYLHELSLAVRRSISRASFASSSVYSTLALSRSSCRHWHLRLRTRSIRAVLCGWHRRLRGARDTFYDSGNEAAPLVAHGDGDGDVQAAH